MKVLKVLSPEESKQVVSLSSPATFERFRFTPFVKDNQSTPEVSKDASIDEPELY